MRQLESLGKALVVLGVVLGAVLAVGLLQWESSSRAAAALANPSPTATIAPPVSTPVPTAAVAQATQPAAIATTAPTAAASPAAAASATASPASTAAAVSTATPAGIGDPVAGAQTFANTCGSCHPNANRGVGPQLHGTQFAAKWPDDTALKAFIRAGRGGMPAFTVAKLSDVDLNNIIAYLRSLK